MRNIYKISLLILIIVIAIVIISIWTKHRNTSLTSADRLYTTKYTNITQKISASGTIAPKREVVIMAGYNGYVKKIYVKTGQYVKAGDPLVSVIEALQLQNEKVYPMTAPYAGKVMIINKTEGQFVTTNNNNNTNDNFIMKIADLSGYFVQATIPEMNIADIKKGQQVIIKATPVLNKTYRGVVETIARAPLPQQQSFLSQKQVVYPVLIKIQNPDHDLRIGMSAVVDIITAHHKHVITLPHEFIHEHNNHYYVILENGKKVPIKTGLQNINQVEITQGLSAGERVRQINFFQTGNH